MPSRTPSIAATPPRGDARDQARARADALRLFQLVTGAVEVPSDAPRRRAWPRRAWPRRVWARLAAALKSRADAADTRTQTADDTAALSAPSLPTR